MTMTEGGKMCMRQREWSDLPPELVSDIADRLGIIELLSFRCVCKTWNSASSTASAELESRPDFKPWFLLYGIEEEEKDHKNYDHQCQLLVPESGENYTMRLPELDGSGTTCLASNQGWLLVFQQGGSMFFFRPFSRTKIDLPEFPLSELSDHVAAFSSPPTSQDCMVCVVSRGNGEKLELNVLRRGANVWTPSKHDFPTRTLKCAAYHKEEFFFFDDRDQLIVFCTKNLRFRSHILVVSSTKEQLQNGIYTSRKYSLGLGMKKKLGLAEDVSISTCGTKIKYDGLDKYIFNETIPSNQVDQESKSRQFKGVWIYPRFYQTSPKDETW